MEEETKQSDEASSPAVASTLVAPIGLPVESAQQGVPTAYPASAAAAPSKPPKPTSLEMYDVKRIEFLGKKVPVLLQAKNGPCPLLAIANQMLLSNRLTLFDHQEQVTLDALVQMVAERLIDANPIIEGDINSENRRKAVADAIDTLPTLAQGLDVNVKFSEVDQFEFDRNLAVFDMLGVNLYHGWLVDPMDDTFGPLVSLNYNTLVERVVNYDSKFGHDENALAAAISNPEIQKLASEGQLAQQFLSTHASQLTYTGLAKLHENVRERELCAFFRNNHFSTMFKFESHLYLLCTDAGFKSRSAVAWERLTDINGDTELCSPTFGDPNAFLSAEDAFEEVSTDAALAKQLQFEEDMQGQNQGGAQVPVVNTTATTNARPQKYFPANALPIAYPEMPMSSDEALARQLQLEEENHARTQQQQLPPRPEKKKPKSEGSGTKSDSIFDKCVIC